MGAGKEWIALVYLVSMIFFSETIGECQTPAQSQEIGSNVRAPLTADHSSRQEATGPFKINSSRFLSAYEDVINILQTQNPCSDFFGSSAVEVFKELAGKLTVKRIPQNVGIRMSGGYQLKVKQGLSVRYRMFDRAEINIRGAFYIASGFISEPRIQPVGPFTPNSPEGRVIMLLHELGHLIEAPSGKWLLSDDGNDDFESDNNTWNVAKHCERVIRAQTRAPRIKLSSGN